MYSSYKFFVTLKLVVVDTPIWEDWFQRDFLSEAKRPARIFSNQYISVWRKFSTKCITVDWLGNLNQWKCIEFNTHVCNSMRGILLSRGNAVTVTVQRNGSMKETSAKCCRFCLQYCYGTNIAVPMNSTGLFLRLALLRNSSFISFNKHKTDYKTSGKVPLKPSVFIKNFGKLTIFQNHVQIIL